MFDFVPWSSLLGGMLLGVSALILLLGRGKIAGISGITNGLMANVKGDRSWRALFIVGLIVGGGIALPLFSLEQPIIEGYSVTYYLLGGLLVGAGSRIGNGCTSGHGICGMGRLSKRSIAATFTFMAVAFVTVFVRHHIL